MKTAHELNGDILKITMSIEDTFPELSKFLAEMTLNSSGTGNGEINIQNLDEYYHSLEALFKNYNIYHHLSK